jgi:drug/metabolite transporter (DMT)-like permease
MFSLASVAVLIAAFCWAGLSLTARKLASTETSFSLSIYITAGPLLVSAFFLPGDYIAPTTNAWGLFVLAGLCSAIAWVGMVGGYRRAPPVILAPFEYTALIGGAIAGYLIWDEIPDQWVVLGGAIIIASGIYIVYREIGNVITNRYLRAFTAGGAAVIFKRKKRQSVTK